MVATGCMKWLDPNGGSAISGFCVHCFEKSFLQSQNEVMRRRNSKQNIGMLLLVNVQDELISALNLYGKHNWVATMFSQNGYIFGQKVINIPCSEAQGPFILVIKSSQLQNF